MTDTDKYNHILIRLERIDVNQSTMLESFKNHAPRITALEHSKSYAIGVITVLTFITVYILNVLKEYVPGG